MWFQKKEEEMDFDENGEEKKSAKPPPPFHDMTGNKAYVLIVKSLQS